MSSESIDIPTPHKSTPLIEMFMPSSIITGFHAIFKSMFRMLAGNGDDGVKETSIEHVNNLLSSLSIFCMFSGISILFSIVIRKSLNQKLQKVFEGFHNYLILFIVVCYVMLLIVKLIKTMHMSIKKRSKDAKKDSTTLSLHGLTSLILILLPLSQYLNYDEEGAPGLINYSAYYLTIPLIFTNYFLNSMYFSDSLFKRILLCILTTLGITTFFFGVPISYPFEALITTSFEFIVSMLLLFFPFLLITNEIILDTMKSKMSISGKHTSLLVILNIMFLIILYP